MSGRITDGATLRRTRLIDLLQQIHVREGMTTVECQQYMTIKYGLKWERTAEYLRELTLSALIKEHEGTWVIRTLPPDLFG